MDRVCVRRPRRASPRRVVFVGMVTAVAAGGATWWFTCTSMSACEKQVRAGDLQRGVEICLASYDETRNDHDLGWAAQAYMSMGKLDEAKTIGRRLLTSRLFGDAHRIL